LLVRFDSGHLGKGSIVLIQAVRRSFDPVQEVARELWRFVAGSNDVDGAVWVSAVQCIFVLLLSYLKGFEFLLFVGLFAYPHPEFGVRVQEGYVIFDQVVLDKIRNFFYFEVFKSISEYEQARFFFFGGFLSALRLVSFAA